MQDLYRAIMKKYHDLNMSPTVDDCWVLDSRNGNLCGPFNMKGAITMEVQLNNFVKQSAPFKTVTYKGESL